MLENIPNTVESLQKELAEALASYKREHMAHSVTLSQLESARTTATMWESMFNSERKASDALYALIKSR